MIDTKLGSIDEVKKRHDYLIKKLTQYFTMLLFHLEDKFGLELDVPKNVSCSSVDYIGLKKSKFIAYKNEHYCIKIREDVNEFDLAVIAAHEFGHFAVFKNSGNYELFNNSENEVSCLFHLVEEGIAEKYKRTGLRFLRAFIDDVKRINVFRYLWALKSDYKIGENIVNSFNDRGVSVKDLVLHPDDYKDYLRKNCNDMAGLSGLVNIGISKLFKN